MRQQAIFLDRDGTLVHPRHYPSLPAHLKLYDGIVSGLCRLQAAGFRLIVVTNQSGIARGYFTFEDLWRMHNHLWSELASKGVRLDAIYACPHHPDGVLPELAMHCACRKPLPGMLLRAAHDFELDLRASWVIGDILDDVEAGHRAGSRTVLVDLGTERAPEQALRTPEYVARNTRHALSIVCAVEGLSRRADLNYLPRAWREPPVVALPRRADAAMRRYGSYDIVR